MQDNVCLQDILNGCIGLDNENHPNAGVILFGGKYYKDKGEFIVDTQRNIISAEIGLTVTSDYLFVEMIFSNPFDLEFRSVWSFLEKYGKDMEKYHKLEKKEYVPCVKMSLVPLCFDGRFLIDLYAPAFWHMKSNDSSHYSKIVLAFPSDKYQFLETEGYDKEEILKQLQREMDTIAAFEAKEYQKQLDAEDEDSYEKRMERAREELRNDKSQW